MAEIITQTQTVVDKVVEKATSISRIMALLMVGAYVYSAIEICDKTNTIEPMPWENIIATIAFYAVGQYTQPVLDFIKDIIPKYSVSSGKEGNQ